MIRVAVLDYDCGNVRSITNALIRIGARPVLTRDPLFIRTADALVIPGVGAFGNAMGALKKYRLVEEIHRFADSGKGLLGICLGMQILFEWSEEFGIHEGLGLIEGVVKKLSIKTSDKIRLPHISWNGIRPRKGDSWEDTILRNTLFETKMYFVHTYAANPEQTENILSLTTYGDCEFVSSVKAGNVYGCQFHPEKSREVGLTILRQFIEKSEDMDHDRDSKHAAGKNRSVLRAAR